MGRGAIIDYLTAFCCFALSIVNIQNATIIQPGAANQDVRATMLVATNNRRSIGGIDFVRVPAGKFIMGNNRGLLQAIWNGGGDEKPQHIIEIHYDYWIGKYPVTNEQFAQFIAAAKYDFRQGNWQPKANHPIVNVSWRDALTYCIWFNERWRSELRSLVVRLPTEAEWEKAARSTDGRTYPWGNDFDINKCNSNGSSAKGTSPVGAYSPWGDSPYGAADMVGNVWEWSHSLYGPYPYQANDGRENEAVDDRRVLRGGSFLSDRDGLRCAFRGKISVDDLLSRTGFRMVAAPPLLA